MAIRSQKYTQTLAASAALRLLVNGSFFKVMAASGSVRVTSDNFDLSGISAGQGVQGSPFGYLLLTNETGAPNVVTVLVADAEFVDASLSTVIVSTNKAPQTGATTSTNKTVTSASGSLLAANANRQYMLIQNNDASGKIWINLAGAAATTANGIKLPPGGSFDMSGTVSTLAVTAIGDLATQSNVVAVEG
jgi:hypothetical protein